MRLKIMGASTLLILVACVVIGCGGSTKTVTVIEKASQPKSEKAAAEPSQGAPSGPKVQTFHGTGQKDLGTITVPPDAVVSWECAACKNYNFIIENSESDPSFFPVNALGPTHGVEPVEAGVYHTVVVDTERGPWTIKIEGE